MKKTHFLKRIQWLCINNEVIVSKAQPGLGGKKAVLASSDEILKNHNSLP